MYEQYLRDPQSVGAEWRDLFDNGRLAELPVIPTTPAEAGAGQAPRVSQERPPAAPSRPAPGPATPALRTPAPAPTPTPAPLPPSPATPLPSPVVTPLTGSAA